MKKRIITPQQVVDLAYSTAGYTNESMISLDDITIAEHRYLLPVVGEELYKALLDGEYIQLVEEYVAPALALYVREWANLDSAPRSSEGMRRARESMRLLIRHIEDNESSYPEYDSNSNAMKRCNLDGGFVQIH